MGWGLRLVRTAPVPAGVLATGAGCSRANPPIHRKNDVAEPCAVTRLIRGYLATGRVRPETNRCDRFPRRYTQADIEPLAQVDEAQ
jgi:hypothetical protein